MQLAREAARLGVAPRVAFVRWDVRGDPEFLEHWALALEDGQVIDMTAAQVDGDPRALRRMDDYPANYVRARRYPVASLLHILGEREPAPGWRYPGRQLWALHRWLFRHDAAAAARTRSLRELAGASRAVVRAAVGLLMDAAFERAMGRLARLLARQDG